MLTPKNKYDERKALEAENRLLRERRENDRLKKDDAANEAAEVILNGLAAFFSGEAKIKMIPSGPHRIFRFEK